MAFHGISSAGLGWNYPCDIWSVGCILVELCSVSNFSFLFSFLDCIFLHVRSLVIDTAE